MHLFKIILLISTFFYMSMLPMTRTYKRLSFVPGIIVVLAWFMYWLMYNDVFLLIMSIITLITLFHSIFYYHTIEKKIDKHSFISEDLTIKQTCIEFKVTRETEKIYIDLYSDGTYEVLNVRVLPNSDIIKKSINTIAYKYNLEFKQKR